MIEAKSVIGHYSIYDLSTLSLIFARSAFFFNNSASFETSSVSMALIFSSENSIISFQFVELSRTQSMQSTRTA